MTERRSEGMWPPAVLGLEHLAEVYRRLSEPFPEDAIERTKATETKRGYDTAGVKAGWLIQRLNDVCGIAGWEVQTEVVAVCPKETRGGGAYVEANVRATVHIGRREVLDGSPPTTTFLPLVETVGYGGHVAASWADAVKGAATGAFKKACSFFGLGLEAWLGALDDDNVPPASPTGRRPAMRPARAEAGDGGPAKPRARPVGPPGEPASGKEALRRAVATLATGRKLNRHAILAVTYRTITTDDLTEGELAEVLRHLQNGVFDAKHKTTGSPKADLQAGVRELGRQLLEADGVPVENLQRTLDEAAVSSTGKAFAELTVDELRVFADRLRHRREEIERSWGEHQRGATATSGREPGEDEIPF